MEKYKFSIIIPHKDIPDLLERCISSIPDRNDIQIIVVDDNSCIRKIDSTKLKGYHRNILLIQTTEGKGAGYARNIALEHIDSKWIMFADADDYFSENLNRFLDEYVNAEEDIIYLINKTIDGESYRELDIDLKVSEALKHCDIKSGNYDYLRYRSHAPWTKMVKSSLIKEYSIRFQEVLASNDVWFSVQCGYYAQKISVCPYPIYIRVVRQGSLQYSLNKERLLSRIEVGYKVNRFLKSIGKIEFYNETWGYLMDLRKISKKVFIKCFLTYLHKTPMSIIEKHILYNMNNIKFKLKRRIRKFLSGKKEYMFWEDNASLKRSIGKYYSYDNQKNDCKDKCLIFMVDGRFPHGGLADRIKGALAVFYIAQQLKYKFKIHWISPFNLEEYLQPNKYNWIIDSKDISYNSKEVLPFYLGSYYKRYNLSKKKESIYQIKKLHKIIERKKEIKQFHIYTNAHFVEELGTKYSELYNTLFKPSKVLNHELLLLLNQSSNYVAASFRFQNLLGDFNDTVDNINNLTKQEQNDLLEDSLALIKKIFNENHNIAEKVLVVSDSNSFIKKASEVPYVITVPGEIQHIDNTKGESYLKEFLDMYMLSNAKKIYRCKKPYMYLSGFPENASRISNIELQTVIY